MIIILFSGHQEGRKLLSRVARQKRPSIKAIGIGPASVLQRVEDIKDYIQLLSLEDWDGKWGTLLDLHAPLAVIDASRPTDPKAHVQLSRECQVRGIPYCLLERESTPLPAHPLIHPAEEWAEAAEKACSIGQTLFLATGTNQLALFVEAARKWNKRLVVRVLPEHKIIKRCQDAGVFPKDIIAMQGPFSRKVNQVLLQAYKADVLVTKDSGLAGGTDTKLAAALAMNIPVVVVQRSREAASEVTKVLAGIAGAWKYIISLHQKSKKQ